MKLSRLTVSAALAAAASGLLFAPGAMAADGTITFTGKIIGQTCDVTTGTGGNFTVNLPLVQTSDFGAVGDTAGSTDFAIGLDNCPISPSGVQVAASFSGTEINTSGRLTNTGTAGGVDVAVYNQGGTSALDITDDGAADGSWATISGTGTADLKYTAKYYATNATVDAGSVASTVDYTLIYQ